MCQGKREREREAKVYLLAFFVNEKDVRNDEYYKYIDYRVIKNPVFIGQ